MGEVGEVGEVVEVTKAEEDGLVPEEFASLGSDHQSRFSSGKNPQLEA